jgi:nicotinamide-nucleotide amidase
MAPNNERQAMVPRGAQVLPNPVGTAPGLLLNRGDHMLIVLPGPPRENRPMFDSQVVGRLPLGSQRLVRTVLHVSGLGESDMDALIAPLYKPLENPTTGILFTSLDLEIHLTARGASLEEGEALNQDLADRMAEKLGKHLYSRGESMEEVVGRELKARGQTLATAESLTGGLIGERMTRVAGASAYFLGSLVTYSQGAKERLLGVAPELLREHSAVSAPVAEAMAAGARERTGADYALSVTGYAGPGGGTEEDPVGTFYVGLADAGGVTSKRFHMPGERELVRLRCSQVALVFLRRKRFL